ncbi:uncharacterized protein LOC113562134 [Ooceraea biroi]|uniref:uncharacterized protein LOC113562134 n=1 Tax=Ooceraea biroi TaxID=2015173 RepID=UPI000F090C7A|nr:uncharacterized protein LOC113562134 [Ooceraea biroi]
MTVFAETNVDVDLRMLRSFRVLRPLKLVSKIPSESVRVLSPQEQQRLISIQITKTKMPVTIELTVKRRRLTLFNILAIFCFPSSTLYSPAICVRSHSYKHSVSGTET